MTGKQVPPTCDRRVLISPALSGMPTSKRCGAPLPCPHHPLAEPPVEVIARAIAVARRSPCAKSRRGAVVYTSVRSLPPGDRRNAVALGSELYKAGKEQEFVILGAGHNGQPEPFVCGGKDVCGDACRRLAVHAEVRAIRNAAEQLAHFYATDLVECGMAQLVHVKIDASGQLTTSDDGPCCEQCSREILDAPIAYVWLYMSVGWCRWHATEFHKATAAALGLGQHLRMDES